jgi:hypothetical protein
MYVLPDTFPSKLPRSRQIDGTHALGAQAAQWLWSKHIERLKVHLKRLVEALGFPFHEDPLCDAVLFAASHQQPPARDLWNPD